MPDDHETDEDSKAVVAVFLGALFVFKMATVALIFYNLKTFETGLFLGITTWYWFPVAAFLLAGPIGYRWRMRKARKRRAELLRAEWMVKQDQPVDDPAAIRER